MEKESQANYTGGIKLMLFSIIVPIYGVEKYIETAIQSVRKQDFEDFELILVDDGSKDRSGEIADSYAEKDSRLRVIHKPNGGVSSARNEGLRNARGTYLIWLDGDDILLPGSLSRLAAVISSRKEPDVIFQNYQILMNGSVFPGTEYHFEHSLLESCDTDDALSYLFGTYPDFNWSACMHVYRLKPILANQIFFNETMHMNEDGNWLVEVLLNARTFAASDDSMYLYRMDVEGSSIHAGADLRTYRSSYTMYTRWFYYFKDVYQGTKAKQIMMGRLARGYVNISTSIYDLPPEERKKAIAMFLEHKDIVPYTSKKSQKPFYPILKLLGTKPYLRAIHCAFRLKEKLKK